MVYKAKVNKEGFIRAYIKLWNGGLGMTTKEVDILAFFIAKNIECLEKGTPEDYIPEIVFGPSSISDMKKKCTLSNSNWGNYKKKMLEKKVLFDGEYLSINPMFLPKKKVTFEFEVI